MKGTGIKLYLTGGNDDGFFVKDIVSESNYVENPEDRVVSIDEEHEMVSTGYANLTPWKCPRDISEDQLGRELEQAIARVQNIRNCIFNFHVPPVNSDLDTCVQLDTSVFPPKPVAKGGQPVYFGAGSTAVRGAIEKHQPLLGLHGHIHESRGFTKIGRTLCLNPGSDYSEGILRGVIVNLRSDRVLSYQFTSG